MSDLPQPNRDRKGKEPCGECHIQPGETCDICGATGRSVAIQRLIDEVRLDRENGVHPNTYNRVYSRHNRS